MAKAKREDVYGDISVGTRPRERQVTTPRDAQIQLEDIYGRSWVQQNWPQIAQMINDPSQGLKAIEGFVQESDKRRQDAGVDQLESGDLPKTKIQTLPDGVQGQLRNTLQQLQGLPGGQQQAQAIAEMADGLGEQELVGLNQVANQELEQSQYINSDPRRQAVIDKVQSYFNPGGASSTVPGEIDRNTGFQGYMPEADARNFMERGIQSAGVANGGNFFKDSIGSMYGQMAFGRQQATKVLNDPNASASDRQQAQNQLSQLGTSSPAALALGASNLVGPGSLLNVPGLDTKNMSQAENIAAMQMGGVKQMYNPLAIAKGMLGGYAARALMPDTAHTGATSGIQHAQQRGNGVYMGDRIAQGGYYGPMTQQQATNWANEEVKAKEVELGRRLSGEERANITQEYIGAQRMLAGTEDERMRNFNLGHVQDMTADRASNILPQLFMPTEQANQQARLMGAQEGNKAFRLARKMGPALPPARGIMQRAGRATKAVGRGLKGVSNSLGIMGMATGALGALQTGLDQRNIAASATGGPSWGADAVGAGSMLGTAYGTEGALAQGVSGGIQTLKGVGQAFTPSAVRNAASAGLNALGGPGGYSEMYKMKDLGRGLGQGGGFGGTFKNVGTRIGNRVRGIGNLGKGIGNVGKGAWNAGRMGVNGLARAGSTGINAGSIGRGVSNVGRGVMGAGRALASPAGWQNFGKGMRNAGKGLRAGAGGLILGSGLIDAGVNAGDAYGMLFGDKRTGDAIREQNKIMGNEAGQRGAFGQILNAGNVVSNARAMQGLQQATREAQTSGAQTVASGYQTATRNAEQAAMRRAYEATGADANTMKRYNQLASYADNPSEMQVMYANNPGMQQAVEASNAAKQNFNKDMGTSGFSMTDAQNLGQYMQGGANTNITDAMMFNGGSENRMDISTSDLYNRAQSDPKAKAALQNMYAAVSAGKLDPAAASSLLGIDASRDREGLLKQLQAAGAQ